MATTALQIENVSKTFGATRALRDVSFVVERGAIHALLGGNGSGKSTLVKILAGVYQADEGAIEVCGDRIDAERTSPEWARSVGLHFVHQNIGTFPDMSVAENFALGDTYGSRSLGRVRWRSLHRDVRAVLDRFEVPVSTRTVMRELRPAEQTMVAIARALRFEEGGERGVLVLDEPTASLPAEEVDVLEQAINGYSRRGHTVVLVSHRLDEVLRMCTHATFLRDGVHVETGSLEGADERSLIRRIAGSDTEIFEKEPAAVGGAPRLRVSGLSVGGVRDASFEVAPGEVLGISGLLGAGRSTLLKTLYGAIQPVAGTIELDQQELILGHPSEAVACGIAYVPEDRAADGVFPDKSVCDNLAIPALHRYWAGWRIGSGAEHRAARDVIDRHGIVAASESAPISSMSGGNQQKAVLARWTELNPRLLLLDEPTQGVDVGARAAIHSLIRSNAASGMSVVIVSSDARELAEVCDRVIGMVKGRIDGELKGDALTATRCIELGHGLSDEAVSDPQAVTDTETKG